MDLPNYYFIRKAGFGEWYWVEGCCGFVVGNMYANPENAIAEARDKIAEVVKFKENGGVGAPSWFYNNQEYWWAKSLESE